METKDKRNLRIYLSRLPELRAKLSAEELIEVDCRFNIAQSTQLDSFEGEIWIDFRNTNGLYSISSYSRIRRNEMESWVSKRGKIKKGMPSKIIKQNIQKGYCRTMISCNNIQISFGVHREFAIHFICNPNNYPMVNHKNGIRCDNRKTNIEWCDNSMNQKHSYQNNGRVHPRNFLGKTGYLCPNSRTVIQMDLEGNYIREWGSASEAGRQLNLYQTSISGTCNGKNKTSGGYKWKYKTA